MAGGGDRSVVVVGAHHGHHGPAPDNTGSPSWSHHRHIRSERRRLREHKRMLQGKLASAVFSHPRPLARYCLDAYATALGLSEGRRLRRLEEEEEGMMMMEEERRRRRRSTTMIRDDSDDGDGRRDCDAPPSPASSSSSLAAAAGAPATLNGGDLLRILGSRVLDSVPLSVLLELVESTCDLSISTVLAAGRVGTSLAARVASSVFDAILFLVNVASRLNPLSVFEFVMSAQRHAVGKTGDVLVSGIQSVATGVGSVSNAALNRLSRGGLAVLAGGEAMMMGGVSRSNGYGHHRVVVMRKDASAVVVGDNLMETKVSAPFCPRMMARCSGVIPSLPPPKIRE